VVNSEREGTDGQTTLRLDAAPKPRSDVPFDLALLALAHVDGLGYKGLRALVSHFGDDLGAVWQVESAKIRRLLVDARVGSAERLSTTLAASQAQLLDKASHELRDLRSRQVTVIAPSRMPRKLADLPDRPWWLFVEGRPDVLDNQPHVAVVGTRTPSLHGTKATEIVVRTMAAYPLVLVSGLANGIDATAHTIALRDGVQNVAFLGHGLNVTFPAETASVRSKIVETGGAVVTEYLPGETYRRQNFVQRNRLQAGLADIVVPVDGAATGGTAHTVRFAAKYSRRLIGIRWEGAGDLVSLVAAQPQSVVLDAFTDEDRRELDRHMRELAAAAGHETYALRLVERLLEREMRHRDVHPSDLARLRSRLDHVGGASDDA